MKGRKKTPSNLKILKGTDQPCRMNDQEPKPLSNKVEKPDSISKKAGEVWDQVFNDLYSVGLLTNIDVNSLTMYCEAYASWQEAHAEVIRKGPLYKDNNGVIRANPYIKLSQTYFEQVKAVMTQFGMTPSSRAGIKVEKKEKEEKNPFLGLSAAK